MRGVYRAPGRTRPDRLTSGPVPVARCRPSQVRHGASSRASSSARTSGRRCWRSVGASALSRAMAALTSTTSRSRSRGRGAGRERNTRSPARGWHPGGRGGPADVLVRDDPRGRGAGVLEHPVRHRPLAGKRIVDGRQRLPLEGQVVELALLHRLADLAVDEALPGGRDLALAVLVDAVGGLPLGLHGRSLSARPSRRRDTRAGTRAPVRWPAMQLIDGRPVFAATDLVGFLACGHRLALERAAMHGLVAKPIRNDPSIELVAKRGLEHERALPRRPPRRGPDRRRDREGRVCGGAARRRRTERAPGTRRGAAGGRRPDVEAMRGRRRRRLPGHLLRRDLARPRRLPAPPGSRAGEPDSAFGPWHYEVADTKLARHVKASAILQICSYVEQLTAIQGRQPEFLHVVLGGSARPTDRLRVADFMAYYRRVKRGVRGGGRAAARPRRRPLPAGRHLPGARGALRGLPLGAAVPCPAPRATTT